MASVGGGKFSVGGYRHIQCQRIYTKGEKVLYTCFFTNSFVKEQVHWRGIILHPDFFQKFIKDIDEIRKTYICFFFRQNVKGDRRVNTDFLIDNYHYLQGYWIQQEKKSPTVYYELTPFAYLLHISLVEFFEMDKLRKIYKEKEIDRELKKNLIRRILIKLPANMLLKRYNKKSVEISLLLEILI